MPPNPAIHRSPTNQRQNPSCRTGQSQLRFVILVLATAGIVWLSEVLVGVVEPVVASLGVSEFFLGIILIPIIGNAAEHLVAVQFASQNKMALER